MQTGVLTGAARAGAKLIVLENLYMYGSTGGQPLHEDLPYAATGKKGRVRAQMALELLEAHRQGLVRTASARAADFIGPGVNYGPVADLFQNALAGKPIQLPGRLDLPHTLTYVPDVARALAVLSEREEALGQAWHIPNPPALTLQELTAKISDALGYSVETRVIPVEYLAQAAGQEPMIAEMMEQAYFFTEPYVVDDRRFGQAFGNIATPWSEAIPATLNWYRHNEVIAAH